MKWTAIILAGIGSAAPAAVAAEETARVRVKDAAIEFTARTVEAEERKIALEGYIVHEGTLYRSLGSPPWRTLTGGTIVIDGEKVTLDVSGIADPWVDAVIEKRFVRLRRQDLGPKPVYTLDVCFVKGGADDFMVTWVISGGKSLRTRIRHLGDTFPAWVSPPE